METWLKEKKGQPFFPGNTWVPQFFGSISDICYPFLHSSQIFLFFKDLNVCLVSAFLLNFSIGLCAFFVWYWSLHFVKLLVLVILLTLSKKKKLTVCHMDQS